MPLLFPAAARTLLPGNGQVQSKKNAGIIREMLTSSLPPAVVDPSFIGTVGLLQVLPNTVGVTCDGALAFIVANVGGTDLSPADVVNPTRRRQLKLVTFPTLPTVMEAPTAILTIETNTFVAGILSSHSTPLMAPGVVRVVRPAGLKPSATIPQGTVVALGVRTSFSHPPVPFAIGTLMASITNAGTPAAGKLVDVLHIIGDAVWGHMVTLATAALGPSGAEPLPRTLNELLGISAATAAAAAKYPGAVPPLGAAADVVSIGSSSRCSPTAHSPISPIPDSNTTTATPASSDTASGAGDAGHDDEGDGLAGWEVVDTSGASPSRDAAATDADESVAVDVGVFEGGMCDDDLDRLLEEALCDADATAPAAAGPAAPAAPAAAAVAAAPLDVAAAPFVVCVPPGQAMTLAHVTAAWASPEAAVLRSVIATLRAAAAAGELPQPLSRVCGAEMLPDPLAGVVRDLLVAADAAVADAASAAAAAPAEAGAEPADSADGDSEDDRPSAKSGKKGKEKGGGGKGGKRDKDDGKAKGGKAKGGKQKDDAEAAPAVGLVGRWDAAVAATGRVNVSATQLKTGGKAVALLEGGKDGADRVIACKEKNGTKVATAIHPQAADAVDAALAPRVLPGLAGSSHAAAAQMSGRAGGDASGGLLAPPTIYACGGAKTAVVPTHVPEAVSDVVVSACGGMAPVAIIPMYRVPPRVTPLVLALLRQHVQATVTPAIAAALAQPPTAPDVTSVARALVHACVTADAIPNGLLVPPSAPRAAAAAYIAARGLRVVRTGAAAPSCGGAAAPGAPAGAKGKAAKGANGSVPYVRVPLCGRGRILLAAAGAKQNTVPADEVAAAAAATAGLSDHEPSGTWAGSVASATLGVPIEFCRLVGSRRTAAGGSEIVESDDDGDDDTHDAYGSTPWARDASGRVLCAVIPYSTILTTVSTIFTQAAVVTFAGLRGTAAPPHPQVLRKSKDQEGAPYGTVATVVGGLLSRAVAVPDVVKALAVAGGEMGGTYIAVGSQLRDAVGAAVSAIPAQLATGAVGFAIDGVTLSGRAWAVAVTRCVNVQMKAHELRGHDVIDIHQVDESIMPLKALAQHIKRRLGGSAWVEEERTPFVRVQSSKMDRVSKVVGEVVPYIVCGQQAK